MRPASAPRGKRERKRISVGVGVGVGIGIGVGCGRGRGRGRGRGHGRGRGLQVHKPANTPAALIASSLDLAFALAAFMEASDSIATATDLALGPAGAPVGLSTCSEAHDPIPSRRRENKNVKNK